MSGIFFCFLGHAVSCMEEKNMDRQKAFPHPLLRLPRPGDREIRAKGARSLPIARERE